jgi:serine/threonine-protein kinase
VIDDRYDIERLIAAGGMAEVFLALDKRHHRRVAIKMLHAELASTIATERFQRDIVTTARLQHPNILSLFDSGEANGRLYYVMPYIQGESLRDRLDRERQLPIDEAQRIAAAMLDALQHAHDQGVVHRDIKPENVLLQGDHVLVADFGVSLALEKAAITRLTHTGVSLGTPQYMSQPAESCRSRRRPTSIPWARCCMRCSPANRRSVGQVQRRSLPGSSAQPRTHHAPSGTPLRHSSSATSFGRSRKRLRIDRPLES